MSEIQILVNNEYRVVNDQAWFSCEEVIEFLESDYMVDSTIQLKTCKVSLTEAWLDLIDGITLNMLNKVTGQFDSIELLPEID